MQKIRHRHSGRRPRIRAAVLLTAATLFFCGFPASGAPQGERAGAPEGFSCPAPSPFGPLLYTPGRGLQLGDTGLTLGGYGNLNLTRDEGGPAELQLDDLSLFVIAHPTPHLHIFSELEVEDLLRLDDRGRGGSADTRFIAERLYGELLASDALELRVGKFLTPVGRWNVIHAQPLVWTTSRPLATLIPFDSHTTGAMLHGSVFPSSGTVTYAAYGQFVDSLDPVPQPQSMERGAGARLEFTPHRGPSLGASVLSFLDRGEWQHLGGLDALWRQGPLEMMGEFVYVDSTGPLPPQWGLYVQNVMRVTERGYLVQRYEHFDQRPPQPEVNLIILGLAFKPLPYVVLKAEYLLADHPAAESPPGIKSSVAVLF